MKGIGRRSSKRHDQTNNTSSMAGRQIGGECDAIQQTGRGGESGKLGQMGKEQEGESERSSQSSADISGRILSHPQLST